MQIAAGQMIAAVADTKGAVMKSADPGTAEGFFPKMLVQMVADPARGNNASEHSNQPSNVMLVNLMMQTELSQQENTMLLSEALLQTVHELEQSGEAVEADSEQLDQLIQQLSALLISMRMTFHDEVPVHALHQAADSLQQEQGKPALKELLQQLHSTVTQSGSSNQTELPLAPAVLQHLNTIKQWIKGDSDTNFRSSTEAGAIELPDGKIQFVLPVHASHSRQQRLNLSAHPNNFTASLFHEATGQPVIQFGSPIQTAQTHLERLNQNANHINLVASVYMEATGQPGDELQPRQEATAEAAFAHPLSHAQEHNRVTPKLVVQQPVPVQEFAESMGNLFVKQLKLSNVNGVSEAKLSLYPEQLGQVDVRITVQNGQVTALFMTENGLAKEMLDNQIAQLRLSLQQQGLQVDKLEVAQSGMHSQLFKDGRHSGQGQQQSSQQHRFGTTGQTEGEFETEWIEQAVINELGYGRGINVTA